MSPSNGNLMDGKNTARSELHKLLVKKLIARYGHDETGEGTHSHPVNHLIQAEVDLFMHSHKKVQAGDLSRLERAVRAATKVKGARRQLHQQAHNSRTFATPRSATSTSRGGSTRRSTASSRGSPRVATPGKIQTPRTSKSTPRPNTAGSVSPGSQQQGWRRKVLPSCGGDSRDYGVGSHREERMGVPSNIRNEWLILETYQQILADEKQAEENRRAQAALQRCKQGLDEQIQQKLARSEKERREADARREQQRRALVEHQALQEELKESSRRKTLEEKCVRATQILGNERRREWERQNRTVEEARILEDCKRKLAEEKERQLQKRKQIAESLREMNRENVAKLAMREKKKISDAEEDKRLMQEYRERLDREQAERSAAHNRRLQRYEMIGNQWAESGAGKRQHDKDIAEERRILAEAAIKEKIDEDREIRDKEALRVDRLRCLEDNKRLMGDKAARKKAEEKLEAEYAQQFRIEGEMHVAKGLERKREVMREKKAYARMLEDQMRETRAALRTVQMTDTERKMNGELLRKLQGDRDLQERIR
ncbi:unnamed protein product [Ectocarpus sp. 13 AM-2016]